MNSRKVCGLYKLNAEKELSSITVYKLVVAETILNTGRHLLSVVKAKTFWFLLVSETDTNYSFLKSKVFMSYNELRREERELFLLKKIKES